MPQILCTGIASQTNTQHWGVTVFELLFAFTDTLKLLRTVPLVENLLRRLVDVLDHPTLLLVEVLSESRFLMRHIHGKCMGDEIELVVYSVRRANHQYLGLESCPCVPSCCIRN